MKIMHDYKLRPYNTNSILRAIGLTYVISVER